MRIRRLNHSVYQIQYHIVWGTKYRRKVLKYYVRKELVRALCRVQKKNPDWYIEQVNTGDDHVHLRLELPPKHTVAGAVNKLKSVSSKIIRNKFKFIDKIYEDGNLWSRGYFVSTIGLNEDQIKKYIEKQSNYEIGEDVTGEFS